jgi:alpha-L-rhamnosidase
MAGIDTDESAPGYKRIIIRPHIGGGLTQASAALDTYYGKVSSAWNREGGRLLFTVEIPANTRATVHIPASSAGQVTEGGSALSASKEIRVKESGAGYVAAELGSGVYRFVVQ